MSAPLVQSMKFNFYNPLVTAIVILIILGIPSYFRTVTPSKVRKLSIVPDIMILTATETISGSR